jgi:CRISPR-associated protein Csb1
MTASVTVLDRAPRLLLEAELVPVQGSRFQPTGFADLGPAEFTRPSDGAQMLLVESAQSVANRLERSIVDGDGVSPIEPLAGLPFVLVELAGEGKGVRTSSLVEAHRLNSPFIAGNKEYEARFLEASGYKKGGLIDWPRAAKAVFKDDPCSLIHGVFFSNLEDGRLRFPRALTGFIEAEHVERAASGGVKNNHFDPSGEIRAVGFDKDVYGNVPYSRLEFTAKRIAAYFNLDLTQVRGYALSACATRLLVDLSLLKIRRFLDEGLRLRTACDFQLVGDVHTRRPDGFQLPSADTLLESVVHAIRDCRTEGLVARENVVLTTETVRKKKSERD